jgi:hypothetical protein
MEDMKFSSAGPLCLGKKFLKTRKGLTFRVEQIKPGIPGASINEK